MIYSKVEGEGKPFLIIHGFLGMSDNWKTLGSEFSKKGFQVHLLDMRNHGRSFHSQDFSYDLMVEDVKEYCDANNLSNIVLLGHSMGGKVAMLFGCKYPELLGKLIVADIGPKFYAPHHQDILAGLNAVDFSKQPSRQEVDELVSKHIKDFGTRQFLLKNLYWKEANQLAFRFNLEVLTREISKIGEALPSQNQSFIDTLFLKGANSDYIKEEDIELILHHFPKATIETIANAGHWLHAENPKDFFNAVIAFLQ